MLLAASCSKNSEPDAPPTNPPSGKEEITLNEAELILSDTDPKGEISFKASADWRVSVSESRAVPGWLTVEPTSGKAGQVTLTVTAQPNEDYDDRNAVITISSGAASKSLTVFQKKKNALILSKEIYELEADQSTIDVEVKSNVDFEVKILDEWITQIQSRGLTTHQLKFAIEANDSYDNREGQIVIKDKSSELADTVHVYQTLSKGLVLTQRDYSISEEGEVIDVVLKSNVDYTVQMPDVEWIEEVQTRSMHTYKHQYKVLPNETYDGREARIIFKDKASSLADTVFIYQTTKNALLLSRSRYEVEATGGNIDVEVKSNVDFEVKIMDEWITQIQSRGLTTHQLKFAIGTNDSSDNREGRIVIKDKTSELTDTVHVYQTLNNGLVLTQREYSVSEEGEVIDVVLKSSVDYTVQMPDVEWIEEVQSRSMQTYKHQYKVLPNETHEEREAQIIFKDKASSIADTVFIYQTTKNALLLSRSRYEVGVKGGNIDVEVKSNIGFAVIISDDWITQIQSRGLTTHHLKFAIKANDSSDNREGLIVIKDIESELADTVHVYQTLNSGLVLTQRRHSVSEEGEVIDVVLKSNVDYNIHMPDVKWIEEVQSQSMQTYKHQYKVLPNETYDGREAQIIFKDKTSNLADTVFIYQTTKNALLLSRSRYEVEATGGNIDVEVKSNVDFEVKILDEWITQIQSRGLTTHQLKFAIKANDSSDNREGRIVIKDKASELADTLHVFQFISLNIGQKRFELDAARTIISGIHITTDNYETKISDNWISEYVNDYTGADRYHPMFEIKANYGTERTGHIIFIDHKRELTDTVIIIQSGGDLEGITKDKNALIAFYNATNGNNWNTKDNWCSDKPLDEWYGVTTNELGRVSGLQLFQNNVNGKLPAEIGDLTNLNYLDLRYNNITELHENIQNLPLLWLEIQDGSLTYIPDYIGNITTLTDLVLDCNSTISGPIPASFGNLKNLTHLNISGNISSIPNELENLTELTNLYISGPLMKRGNISESFPQWIGKLRKLKSLTIQCLNLSGTIPDGFYDLSDLEYLHLSILSINGTLSQRISNLVNLKSLLIQETEMSGTLPTEITSLTNLKVLNLSENNFSGAIPSEIASLANLEFLILNDNNFSGAIPSEITSLANLEFLILNDNNFSGAIPSEITSLTNLKSLNLSKNNLDGSIPHGFGSLVKLESLSLCLNCLSGIIPDDFEQNPNCYATWDIEQSILPQKSPYTLSFGSELYASTDFSADGQVMTLQKATTGKGVDIVLLGDGFVDRDMASGGKYEQTMQEACESLFALEPMKSYREYFNVYAVKAVSLNEKFRPGASTAFSVSFEGGSTHMQGDDEKCIQYALKAPVHSRSTTTVTVIANTNSYSGTTYSYTSGESVCYVSKGDFSGTFIHEVVGHGLGKLADEYVTNYYETIPADKISDYNNDYNQYGWYANIDFTSDPSQIRWKHMLQDPRYSSYTGVVLGGGLYDYGVWRPEERSMMRDNDPYFNAPSREAIVKRIMRLAGEEYSFEKFAAKDKYVPLGTKSRSKTDKDSKIIHNPSPVIIRR